MECIKKNWLCKHMKKVRSSQAASLVLNWVKHSFSLRISLTILTGKKQRQIELQRLQRVWIWTFRLLVHQINPLWQVFKLKQNFKKNKVVIGKIPFFMIGVIGAFCTHRSICLNIRFWYDSFVKNGTPVF